jgi:hypothetical protein
LHNKRLQNGRHVLAFGLLLIGEEDLRRNEDDPKEKSVSEKSTARHESPVSIERDTLPTIDQLFLRDQLEALLSSHVVSGHTSRGDECKAEQADSDAPYERDTEPSADALLLRDAILAAGKSA